MSFRFPPSEDIGVLFGRPEALAVALYVRDALGLPLTRFGATARRLEPRVTAKKAADDPAIPGQWGQWWRELLHETVPAVRENTSVDYFGALSEKEALREAAEPLLQPAREWFVAHRRPHDLVRRPGSTRALVEGIARDELGRRRRTALGKLLFLPLPLEGASGYGVGRGSWIVTEALVADFPAFESWLHVQMRFLASRGAGATSRRSGTG